MPDELSIAGRAARDILGDSAKIKYGISDYGKDRLFMMKSEGDYTKAGATPISQSQAAVLKRLRKGEKRLFPKAPR